ncbi:MAG: glycosyltransferase family 2 protein [Lachnospiraceae bacterium]|nr:glycosyltransferase family 2 protein [Lachnospiraceae bacterium]
MKDTILYFVLPCYNEEAVLPETAKRLYAKCDRLIKAGKISPESRILFVNDGSKDSTWMLIEKLHSFRPIFAGLNLSRNRGHQNALLAGLMYAKDYCDIAVSMDADLQDDIDAVDEMISKYEGGCDIVYGVRNNRDTDSWFKRTTARGFYRLMTRMGVEMVSDSADYRLMSRRALLALSEFKEVNLFLRGMVPMIGMKTDKVFYKRGERFAGESKYPLRKMLAFSIEGITSLSVQPIRLITNTGIFVFLISLALLIWGIMQKVRGVTVSGWASLIVSIWAIGGLILLGIGVIGEYIGKIYLESKARPRFIIDTALNEARKKEEDPISVQDVINEIRKHSGDLQI